MWLNIVHLTHDLDFNSSLNTRGIFFFWKSIQLQSLLPVRKALANTQGYTLPRTFEKIHLDLDFHLCSVFFTIRALKVSEKGKVG